MAAETELAESAQAFFFGLIDYWGLQESKKIFSQAASHATTTKDTEWNFLKTQKLNGKTPEQVYKDPHVFPGKNGAKIPWSDMDAFLSKKNGWYESSRNIGLAFIADLKKLPSSSKFPNIGTPDWQSIYYVRDDAGTMQTIAELFKIAKDNTKKLHDASTKVASLSNQKKLAEQRALAMPRAIGAMLDNINKWSTADIYLTSNAATTALKTSLGKARNDKLFDIFVLNKLIWSLWQQGHLLPISLKKVGAKQAPIIKALNVKEPPFQISRVSVSDKVDSDAPGIKTTVVSYVVDKEEYQLNLRPRVDLAPIRESTAGKLWSFGTKLLINVNPKGGVPSGGTGPSVLVEHPMLATEQGKVFINIMNKYWGENGLLKKDKLMQSTDAKMKSLITFMRNYFGAPNSSARKQYLKTKDTTWKTLKWQNQHPQQVFNEQLTQLGTNAMKSELSAFFSAANGSGAKAEGVRQVLKVIHMFTTAQTFDVSSKYVLIK